MPKAKSVKKSNVTSNQKYIIVAAALALAAAGYFGWRSMAVTPDINKIDGVVYPAQTKTKPATQNYQKEYVGPIDRAKKAPIAPIKK